MGFYENLLQGKITKLQIKISYKNTTLKMSRRSIVNKLIRPLVVPTYFRLLTTCG